MPLQLLPQPFVPSELAATTWLPPLPLPLQLSALLPELHVTQMYIQALNDGTVLLTGYVDVSGAASTRLTCNLCIISGRLWRNWHWRLELWWRHHALGRWQHGLRLCLIRSSVASLRSLALAAARLQLWLISSISMRRTAAIRGLCGRPLDPSSRLLHLGVGHASELPLKSAWQHRNVQLEVQVVSESSCCELQIRSQWIQRLMLCPSESYLQRQHLRILQRLLITVPICAYNTFKALQRMLSTALTLTNAVNLARLQSSASTEARFAAMYTEAHATPSSHRQQTARSAAQAAPVRGTSRNQHGP